eukprot:31144-Pelagococcus_subviridis.AAC.13
MFERDAALEPRLRRIPLPPSRVPRSLTRMLMTNAASGEGGRASSSGSGSGNPFRDATHPRRLRVPDYENALADGCELTPTPRADGARRMRCGAANAYVAELFRRAARCSDDDGDGDGAAAARLSRYDLFHAHVFVRASGGRGGVVGLLMHALEYPRYDDADFPFALGNCQRGSDVAFAPAAAAGRNILWTADAAGRCAFARLDTSETSPLRGLLTVPALHTTYEGDFGDAVLGDLLYFNGVADGRKPKHSVFAFPR